MTTLDELIKAARGGATGAMVDLRQELRRLLQTDQAGRSEVDRFLRQATPRDWITLDEAMRAYWYGLADAAIPWWSRIWQAVRSSGTEPSDVLAVGLSSMERDGRTREAAVRRLEAERDTLVGPFLALRTTDWVEEVATVAVALLTERMTSDGSVVVAAAPLLFALTDRQRRTGTEAVVLERAATDNAVRTALLASADTHTRRRTISDANVRAVVTLDELVKLAKTDSDTVVASTAGVEAVARTTGANIYGLALDSLLAGPALVRRAVLDALADRGTGRDPGERHLFDRSATVRAAAHRAYRAGGGDPAATYRAALARGEHAAIAVSELALVGSSADRGDVLRALQSPDAATRRAAVNAARWVAGERLAELIAPLLWDSSAGVTRAVERRLRAMARDLDAAMLAALASAPRSHNRRAAYRLMRRRSAPERVEADLIALADADDHVRRDGLADVRSWLHRGAASAPRGDVIARRRLSERLDAVEHQLSRDDVTAIRFHAGLRRQDLPT